MRTLLKAINLAENVVCYSTWLFITGSGIVADIAAAYMNCRIPNKPSSLVNIQIIGEQLLLAAFWVMFGFIIADQVNLLFTKINRKLKKYLISRKERQSYGKLI